jgi:hypothetical protein
MNIIELFDKLELNREAIAGYTASDVIRVEKQLNVERKINPEIDANTAANLVHALRDFAEPFVFVLGNRHLCNFFTGKDLPRKRFPEYPINVDQDAVRNFIARFLADDLELRLDKALADERFGSVRELLIVGDYLPEESMHRLEKRMTGKLEFGIGRMPREGKVEVSGIGYMRLMSFYEVLSHFSSIEMDEKIRIVINRTSDMYNSKREAKFASDIMICLPSYKAFDEDLNRVTGGNRGIVSGNTSSGSKSSGSGWASSGRIIFIVIIIIVKLAIFSSKCSRDDSNNYNSYDNGYGVGTGSGIDNSAYQLRINDAIAENFADYLSMYNRDSIADLKPIDSIKTGQNPFLARFTNRIGSYVHYAGEQSTITNRSPYDIVLLEYANEAALNIPLNAYYIKSGHKFTLNVANKNDYIPEYSFYFGNNLASFKADKTNIKRNDSLNELRFTKLAPYCREILGKKFSIAHDVTIIKDGGHLKMKSEGLKGVTDSLTKQGEYIF